VDLTDTGVRHDLYICIYDIDEPTRNRVPILDIGIWALQWKTELITSLHHRPASSVALYILALSNPAAYLFQNPRRPLEVIHAKIYLSAESHPPLPLVQIKCHESSVFGHQGF
jgi:hypothetical protein